MNTKRDEFFQEFNVVDRQDLMESEVTKWGRIFGKIKASIFSTYYRDKIACKGKWHLILLDYY